MPMTEEQKKRKAERQKKYRENKKLKAERATLDATSSIPVLDYPQTDFDVLMRRMRRESAK